MTGDWEEIALLRRAELESLFGPALPERFGPLVKSWVCVQACAVAERCAGVGRPGGWLSPRGGRCRC